MRGRQSQALGETVKTRSRVSPLARSLLGAETPSQVREALAGYAFASPWLLGLLLFFGGPILASLLLSFTSYSLVQAPDFVGLENFQKAFTGDPLFLSSLARTFAYSLIYMPTAVLGSLFLAVLLNQKLSGTTIFRTVFFLPHLTPGVALAVLWGWLLQPKLGPINYGLGQLGLPQPGWLGSIKWAMPAVIMMSLWAGVGGNRMLIFLAGLQGVPQELYESAEIDGAGGWAKFWNITLPMISPVIFFNMILGVIGALQVFTTAFVATQGGPGRATWFLALHIYAQGFRYFRLGYASTLAWLLAIILIAFTYIQIKLSNRWVFYNAAG